MPMEFDLIVSSSPFVFGLNFSATLVGIAFFGIWFAAWLPLAIPLAIRFNWRPPQPLAMSQKLTLVASLYALVPLLLWGMSEVEGVSLSTYGLTLDWASLRSVAAGLAIALGGLGLFFALQWGLGWIEFNARRSPVESLTGTILPSLVLALWIGASEEVVFRGFLLYQLQQDYSSWIAAAIASVVFALLHLVWDARDTLPQLPGLVLMGMVLAVALWVDGSNIALPWGLHAGWIWGIASVDGLEVIRAKGTVPAWIGGIDGNPLAGGLGLVLLGLTGVAIAWGG